jgi:hypothetical protein
MKFRFQAGKKMPSCRCGESFSLNALKRGRAKKQKESPKRQAPNPLRLDPTRTAGIRRAVMTDVNARFTLLKRDVLLLILDQDALSINEADDFIFNAFCPTGEGHGSSNKCAPKKGKGKGKSKGGSGRSAASSPAPHAPHAAPHATGRASLVSRLKGAVGRGAMAIYGRMVLATPHMWKAMQLFTDVFDHPDDLKKFGYQPSLGTAGHETHDALKQAGLPFGTHLAAKIVTEVVSRGVAFAKKYRAGRKVKKAQTANELILNSDALTLVTRIVLSAINIVHAELGFEPMSLEELQAILAAGMKAKGLSYTGTEPTTNAGRWSSLDDRGKVKAFKDWIRTQARARVLTEWEQMWGKHADEAWKKGVQRAYDDTKAPRKALASDKEALKIYEGSRDEFTRTALTSSKIAERVSALAARVHNDMEGVVDHMSTVMTRLLADGLSKKQTAREIARTLSNAVDAIGKNRAMTVVNTEIVRAHAEGQLDALEALGVTQIGVQVEWRVNPASVCPLCAPLLGIVVKIDEARGMIPRHPSCKCAWQPANVGESTSSQKRNKGRIDKAITKSQKEEGGSDWGPGEPISRKRPTRNEEPMPVLITPALIELEQWLSRGETNAD